MFAITRFMACPNRGVSRPTAFSAPLARDYTTSRFTPLAPSQSSPEIESARVSVLSGRFEGNGSRGECLKSSKCCGMLFFGALGLSLLLESSENDIEELIKKENFIEKQIIWSIEASDKDKLLKLVKEKTISFEPKFWLYALDIAEKQTLKIEAEIGHVLTFFDEDKDEYHTYERSIKSLENDEKKSHVITALISDFYEASLKDKKSSF